jgi:hypothetical protein
LPLAFFIFVSEDMDAKYVSGKLETRPEHFLKVGKFLSTS